MDKVLRSLKHSAVFGRCSEERLSCLLEQGYFEMESCQAGEDMLECGRSGRLCVVVEGEVKVYRDDSHSKVTLNVLHEGDCFGASTMFASEASVAAFAQVTRVEALKRAVVAFITEEKLCELLTSDRCICLSYVEFLTGRIRFLNSKLHTFSGGSTAEKAAKMLLGQYRSKGECITPNYAEMARRLNIGRASLYRALDAMERQGAIRRTEHTIEVLDEKKLSEIR